MARFVTSCFVILGVIVAASVFAVETPSTKAVSLNDSVNEFNAKATKDPIGKSQLPLTEDEVIAAIRGWIREQTPAVTDEMYKQFQEIAESGKLPDRAELSFTTGWIGYRGFHFQVWWIDLTIRDEKTGYTFRIRDQKISSRKLAG